MFFRTKFIQGTPLVQLVESYRNAEGLPRQRVVASLGDADIAGADLKPLARAVEQHLGGQGDVLDAGLSEEAARWVTRDDEKFDQAGGLCGNYVLRTDRQLGAAHTWPLFMTLLQAEEGYACLKGSQGLRPNHHQLQERVDANIFITVLAYHLLCRVREKLRDSGDMRDWKTVRRLLATHSLATTRLPLEDGRVLHIRKATDPDAEQAEVYRKLGINWKAKFPTQ